LRGFAETSFREEVERRQEHHRLRMQGLEDELSALRKDIRAMQAELEEMEAKPLRLDTENETFRSWVADKLMDMHVEQSASVLAAKDRLERQKEEHGKRDVELRAQRSAQLKELERRLREALRQFDEEGGGNDESSGT